MHNGRLFILAALAALALAIAVQAQERGPGTGLPSTFPVVMQINDARGNQTLCSACWDLTYPIYKFAAGKNFTLIIRETASSPLYPPQLQDYRVSSVANGTGFVTFNLQVPAGTDVTRRSKWYVALVVQWPVSGVYWLIYEREFPSASLLEVIGNLSGRPELSGYSYITSDWGVLKVVNGPGRFGNLSSSVIHIAYIGINTLGRPFTLTFTRTLTTDVSTYTLEDGASPASGPTSKASKADSRITAVFGPLAYLGTYVTSLGKAGTSPSDYKVSIDPSKITYKHTVYLAIDSSKAAAITSTNSIFSQYGSLRYVVKSFNFTTQRTTVLSCGNLTVWSLNLYNITITGVLDLKGNPVLNPESLRFKVQLRVGDDWVTFDRAQGSWRGTIGGARDALYTVCGLSPGAPPSDLLSCIRSFYGNRGKFISLILALYNPVVLTRLAGQLQLTDDSYKFSYGQLQSKLVVEYVYDRSTITASAIVLEMALAEPASWRGILNVSLLPVLIRLWRWSNLTLPPNVSNPFEYYYSDPLDLSSLRFVVDGDAMYFEAVGTDAVSYDPWPGGVIWALPPYQVIPGFVGQGRASIPALLNSSGYLPLPALVANFTTGGRVAYFNYSDAIANSNYFAKFGIGITASYSYRFRIYYGDLLVGTANLVASYPIVNRSGIIIPEKADQALKATYGDPERRDMYNLQIVRPTGFVYDVEHVLHIAIVRVFQNLLLRDACGNPPFGVNGRLSLVLDLGGGVNITKPRLPLGGEVPVDIWIPVDQFGNPLVDIQNGYVRAQVVLDYYGYRLYGAPNASTVIAAQTNPDLRWILVPVKIGIVKKPLVYLPLAPLLFRVWSQAIAVDVDPLKDVLWGFVVSVRSTATDAEIGRSISNRKGEAYVPNVPLGVPFRVVVRTISPDRAEYGYTDVNFPYTAEQVSRRNSYGAYQADLGITSGYAYTLGTRYEEAGVVVYDRRHLLDSTNASAYICAKAPIDLPVAVFDLTVRVFDKTGQYLLRSGYAYLGPYPQATRPFLLNVTLLLADGVYPQSSYWRNQTAGDFKVLTDFRTLGMTGSRSIYRALAARYLSAAQNALNCPSFTNVDYPAAVNAYTLAAMAGFVANASTDSLAAVFRLTSNQPKDILDVCTAKPDQVGAGEIARLFLNNTQHRFVVWYMGYKVFDDYVTIRGPVVDIRADVYPVNTTAWTKDLTTRVSGDVFVGFTFADAYLGAAANRTDAIFANQSQARYLIRPFDQMYNIFKLYNILKDELGAGTPTLYNVKVAAYKDANVLATKYYGAYVPATYGVDFAYFPNLALIRNGTAPKYQATLFNNFTTRTISRTVEQPGKSTAFVIQLFSSSSVSIYLPSGVIPQVLDFSTSPPRLAVRAYSPTAQVQLQGFGTMILNGTPTPIAGQSLPSSPHNYYVEVVVQGDNPTMFYSGTQFYISVSGPANITITAVNKTSATLSETVSLVPGEYVVGFDRWFLVPYDFSLAQYNVLYRSASAVERSDVLRTLLSTGRTSVAAAFAGAKSGRYNFTLTLTGLDVSNYRTAWLVLPWKLDGTGRAVVYVAAYFADNGTLIDTAVYNVTQLYGGTRARQINVTVPLLFGRVARLAYDIASQNLAVKYVITVTPVNASTVFATKLVPLYGNYSKVSMYECTNIVGLAAPGALDPTVVVYSLDYVGSVKNGFNATYGAYGGFGVPLTYVVREGEVALLPSWYGKTSVNGSRIARIWIIAASQSPAVGPALGTQYFPLHADSPDGKVSVAGYKFQSYLVVNFVPNLCPAGYAVTSTYLDEFDGSGRIYGFGFGTGGTSSLIIGDYLYRRLGLPYYDAWNVPSLYLAAQALGGSLKLPTVALNALTVQNDADFPIYVTGLTVRYAGTGYTYEVGMPLVRVASGAIATVPLRGYGFGRTYIIRPLEVWNATYMPAPYEYGLKVYHGGLIDAARRFGLAVTDDVVAKLQPLTSAYYSQNVLYASHAEKLGWTFNILNGKRVEYTNGTWGRLNVYSNDTDYKYVFTFPTLPLAEIRDWNDRPLANQTIALFDDRGRLYAVTYSDNLGRLAVPLPKIASPVVRISWFYGYLVELLRGRPEYTIWIYDSGVQTDVSQLGDATTQSKVRTWVYPLTVTVADESNRPIAGVYVKVVDRSSRGGIINLTVTTGADGSAPVIESRVSSYASGTLSQMPATDYEYYVYDSNGLLIAYGSQSLQRGATVPSQGYNIRATVSFISEIPVKNSGTTGYLLVKGARFLNGTVKDVRIPFTISEGRMKLASRLPALGYAVELHVTSVSVGGREVPVAGGDYLAWTGTLTDLLKGLDFAELGITSVATISAVDSSGAVRPDWQITVRLDDIVAAQGGGQVNAVLPTSRVLGKNYTVSVATNVARPDGSRLTLDRSVAVSGPAYSLRIPISAVKLVVLAVDGFGRVRSDFSVEIRNVASGTGRVEADVIEGEAYAVSARGLGYVNSTTVTARAPQVILSLRIPTAYIAAIAVDGFGRTRSDFPVDIRGVASGMGMVQPREVLAGTYTVVATAFGREFSQQVTLAPGANQTVVVRVPTAVINVVPVDDDKKPLYSYVTYVAVRGAGLNFSKAQQPFTFEVLGGNQYTITAGALGKEGTYSLFVPVGQEVTVQVTVPGTAGIDLFPGYRIALPTLVLYGLLLAVIVIILAILIIEYNNWRRRRLMQILAPPK